VRGDCPGDDWPGANCPVVIVPLHVHVLCSHTVSNCIKAAKVHIRL